MGISASLVKELREKTGAGMMDCKKALVETEGNFEKAIDFLRKKGIAKAGKKSSRATTEGAVGSYIHSNGKVGVLVEINCETDFVARTEQFKDFVKSVSMHIAAANPQWVSQEEVPEEIVQKEKEIAAAQMREQGKPEKVVEKAADGKAKKFLSENCLLDQSYVKDPDKSVQQVLKEAIANLGENISIKRFCRFAIGE